MYGNYESDLLISDTAQAKELIISLNRYVQELLGFVSWLSAGYLKSIEEIIPRKYQCSCSLARKAWDRLSKTV